MWQQTLAIFIVLSFLITCLWLLRRKGLASMKFGFMRNLSGGPRRMELLERMSLTPHHSLHLVRIENQLILVGVSPQSCALVDSVKAAPANTSWSTGAGREGL